MAEKRKRALEYAAFAASYLFVCAALLWLHYGVYGGMLLLRLRVFAIVMAAGPPVLLLLWLLLHNHLPRRAVRKRPRGRGGTVFRFLCITLFAVAAFFGLAAAPLDLTPWVALWLVCCWAVLWLAPGRGGFHPLQFAYIYLSLLAAVGLYLAVVRPAPCRTAAQSVRDSGYTVKEYAGAGRWTPEIPSANPFGHTLGYYVFNVERDGYAGYVAVSVIDGKIVEANFS